METFQCIDCKELKLESEFYFRNIIKDGQPYVYRDKQCKICFRLRAESYNYENNSHPRNEIGNKICRICKKSKPVLEFPTRKENLDGLCSYCRDCKREKTKPHRFRYNTNHRYVKYGISKEEHESLIQLQNNKCAICGKPPKRGILCIDHDHTTGKVRGLLCSRCNHLLGRALDSIEILQSAITYLQNTPYATVASTGAEF